jgi:hypothetical protein
LEEVLAAAARLTPRPVRDRSDHPGGDRSQRVV